MLNIYLPQAVKHVSLLFFYIIKSAVVDLSMNLKYSDYKRASISSVQCVSAVYVYI